ncbi:Ankyrin repeat and death domain-containing protein 1A isoform 1 [Schistosoma japonicum]|uniref:Ankyrin repeat and death domain-containing protein 1A isoform 1 n=1 Tax=Schistosoma japonicum TaxID=6182 RepID=A0A4Z2CV82_SCHJA|nr:Ankyrin repeat and death domain-containing protein 1A isoform 1 [Schistosoma japonicum]
MKSKKNPVLKVQSSDCNMVTISIPPELRKIEQILFASVKQNRIDLVNRIIEGHKCDLNVRDSFDRTPLHLASSSGNLQIVKLLVEGKAIVDPVDKFGITPLFWAVYNNYKHVAYYLLDMGAKYNRVTKQGFTILHFIAESNAISILKYLHRKVHSLEYDTADNNGITPFLLAASKGNELLMEILIRQKCNVTATDMSGRTALHHVSKNGHIDALNYLLSIAPLKMKINGLDNFGCTALHLACENNQQHCVRLLLEAGANPEIQSEARDYPLIECSRRGFHKCIDLLIGNKASREKRSKAGDTALHVAALANLSDTIYFLFSRKFDICATNENKQTPLHYAVSQDKLEAVEALLFCGAPLNVKDKDGQTPLMVAAKANYTALVDMIIRADRWNKAYPADACKLINEILQIQQMKHSTTRILDKTQTDLQSSKRHEISQNNQTQSLRNNDSIDYTKDKTSQDSDSDTYTGQRHQITSNDTQSVNTLQHSIPFIYPDSLVYSPNSSLRDGDMMMPEFIDPFKQLQLQETDGNRKLVDGDGGVSVDGNIETSRLIVDHRSRSTASSESDSELSLGYEASRVWHGRRQQLNDPLTNSISLLQVTISRDFSEPNLSREFIANYNGQCNYANKYQSHSNLTCPIQGDEIYLPNGETIFRITDTLIGQSSKSTRLLNEYGVNLSNPFTFRAPFQLCRRHEYSIL